MKLSRTTVLLSTAMVAAMVVSGCSAAPQKSDPTGPVWDNATGGYVMEDKVASGEVPLTLWVEYQPYGDAIVKAFNEVHPKVKIDVKVVAKVDAPGRMALDGEAGTGADVFTLAYDGLAGAIDTGVAASMGNYQEEITKRVGPSFAKVVSRDGAMYGVPISTESIALFYNKTLLKKLTGSDSPASTWEEVAKLAKTYNNSTTNTWTIRFLAGELYYAYPVLSSLGWKLYPDGKLDKPQLDSVELSKGLAYYRNLREIWNVNSADANYDSIENEFVKGQTPYVITGPWTFTDFNKAAASAGFEYGVTTLPKVEGGKPAASLAGLSVAAVSGYTKYPAAARVLAAFLASDAGAKALYSSIGAIPALTPEYAAAVPNLANDKHAQGILAQSQQGDLVPQIPKPMYTVGNALVATVWDGVKDPTAAQQQAVADYDNLYKLGK